MTLVSVKPAIRRRSNLNLDRWLDEMFRLETPRRAQNNGLTYPPVNVLEFGDQFQIQIAAPGMDKGDFEIKVEKDLLTISGRREQPAAEGETFRRREFGAYTFKRHFQLPDTLDTGAVQASYVNGVLLVAIPKREEAKEKPPRKIEIA
jgi:HSP20 family protein